MRVLATAMVIALAVLASIAGKGSQTKQPLFDKGTIGDLTIRYQDQGGCADATKPGAPSKSSPMISWQSIVAMARNFKEAFNDPSLIEYANQQGISIPDSSIAHSKSRSSHSGRSWNY
jgi:hypothetical protein